MIVFFLPWWTYVLIGTVAFTCSFGAVWLAGIAFDREQPDDEPYPCLAFMWTGQNGVGVWCWLEHGHGGEHSSHVDGPVFGDGEDLEYVSPGVYEITTAADEDDMLLPATGEWQAPLPALPQRMSKVPVQTEHNDPWPQCADEMDGRRCRLTKSHLGPHEWLMNPCVATFAEPCPVTGCWNDETGCTRH